MSAPVHPFTRRSGFAPALVAAVLDDALAHGARVYAIAGVQGSGKSTLAAQLVAAAHARGLRALAWSLDDTYHGRRERQALARRIHPLFAHRGPPGTHDLALACDTMDALRAGRAVRVPRFDKLADRRLPPSRWRSVQSADLIIFEGWCLKTPAQSPAALRRGINPLERDEDPHGLWRDACNARLRDDYPALWQRLDRLLYLQAPSFDVVPAWRWQQEQHLQAQAPRAQRGRAAAGFDHTGMLRFVQLFERVSRQGLRTLPEIAELRIRLDSSRQPMLPRAQASVLSALIRR